MATEKQAVSGTPVDIVSTKNLVSAKRYAIQNVGSHRVLIAEASSAPDLSADPAFSVIMPMTTQWRTVGSDGLWVWSDDGSLLAIDEA